MLLFFVVVVVIFAAVVVAAVSAAAAALVVFLAVIVAVVVLAFVVAVGVVIVIVVDIAVLLYLSHSSRFVQSTLPFPSRSVSPHHLTASPTRRCLSHTHITQPHDQLSVCARGTITTQ